MSETTTPATRSFACDSCKGEIQIPYDLPSTTGPCPLCKATITSPPPPNSVPAPGASTPGAVPAAAPPVPEGEAPIKLSPEKTALPPKRTGGPASLAGQAEGPEKPAGGVPGPAVDNLVTMPGAPPSGGVADRSAAQNSPPGSETPPAPPAPPASGGKAKRKIHPAIPFLAAILLIVGVLVVLVMVKRKDPSVTPPVVADKPGTASDEDSEEARRLFLRDGWKSNSSDTLAAFLRATTVEEKAQYVIGGESRIAEMKEFYAGESSIDESDTPIELFSHFDLDIADKKRGLFLMQFERPEQYDIKEFFRPVAPLEVQHKLEEPGLLLSAFAARENFAMEPMRVMVFFREVDNKLLLDWDVYAQTKYRTLRHFISHPQPGKSKVFRVMIREVIPPGQGIEGADVSQYRQYRFLDPAHGQDLVDIKVDVDSTPGRILADVAFINIPGKEPQNRYGTVDLKWSDDEEPQLGLKKVICWEFLNLGGVAGNATPVELESDPLDLDSLGPDPLAPPVEGSPEPVTAPGEGIPGGIPGD